MLEQIGQPVEAGGAPGHGAARPAFARAERGIDCAPRRGRVGVDNRTDRDPGLRRLWLQGQTGCW